MSEGLTSTSRFDTSMACQLVLDVSRSACRFFRLEKAIPKRGWCYQYLKWLGITPSLSLSLSFLDYLYSSISAQCPLNVHSCFFPQKRFLLQSHACSTLSFRYTRVTYVTCLFILVVCGTCNLYLLPPP